MAKLTPKQKKFADEYIKTGNATDSYIKAYGAKAKGASGRYGMPRTAILLLSRVAKTKYTRIGRRLDLPCGDWRTLNLGKKTLNDIRCPICGARMILQGIYWVCPYHPICREE